MDCHEGALCGPSQTGGHDEIYVTRAMRSSRGRNHELALRAVRVCILAHLTSFLNLTVTCDYEPDEYLLFQN